MDADPRGAAMDEQTKRKRARTKIIREEHVVNIMMESRFRGQGNAAATSED